MEPEEVGEKEGEPEGVYEVDTVLVGAIGLPVEQGEAEKERVGEPVAQGQGEGEWVRESAGEKEAAWDKEIEPVDDEKEDAEMVPDVLGDSDVEMLSVLLLMCVGEGRVDSVSARDPQLDGVEELDMEGLNVGVGAPEVVVDRVVLGLDIPLALINVAVERSVEEELSDGEAVCPRLLEGRPE